MPLAACKDNSAKYAFASPTTFRISSSLHVGSISWKVSFSIPSVHPYSGGFHMYTL